MGGNKLPNIKIGIRGEVFEEKLFVMEKKSAGKPSGTEIRFSVSKLKDGRPRRNTCRCCSKQHKN